MTPAADLARAILQARNAAQARGDRPRSVVLDRGSHDTLSRSGIGIWDMAGSVLFGLQVEVDDTARGWVLICDDGQGWRPR